MSVKVFFFLNHHPFVVLLIPELQFASSSALVPRIEMHSQLFVPLKVQQNRVTLCTRVLSTHLPVGRYVVCLPGLAWPVPDSRYVVPAVIVRNSAKVESCCWSLERQAGGQAVQGASQQTSNACDRRWSVVEVMTTTTAEL